MFTLFRFIDNTSIFFIKFWIFVIFHASEFIFLDFEFLPFQDFRMFVIICLKNRLPFRFFFGLNIHSKGNLVTGFEINSRHLECIMKRIFWIITSYLHFSTFFIFFLFLFFHRNVFVIKILFHPLFFLFNNSFFYKMIVRMK